MKKEDSSENCLPGDLENVIYNHPISQDIDNLKSFVRFTEYSFFDFFLACSDKKFEKLISYIQSELDIKNSAVYNIDLSHEDRDIVNYLNEILPKIENNQFNNTLIIAHGFEKIINEIKEKEMGDISLMRIVHDYQQNIYKNSDLVEKYRELGKNIFIITHIGMSLGNETYNAAVESAINSQFKQIIIKVNDEEKDL